MVKNMRDLKLNFPEKEAGTRGINNYNTLYLLFQVHGPEYTQKHDILDLPAYWRRKI